MRAVAAGFASMSLLAATALQAQDGIRTAQDASRTKIRYETLVERYAHGEHDAALARFGEEGIEGFARRVGRIEDLDRDGLDAAFRGRWRLAVGSVYLQRLDSEAAQYHLRSGLDLAKDDALLMTALGAAYEQPASVPVKGSAFLVRSQQNPALLREQLLGRALGLYERALEADPACADAHLRLAWTHFYEERPERAASHIEWLLHHAIASDIRYVAHLLAGRALEREGALDTALAQYREAARLDPRGATAQLAVSHVLSRTGDEPGAVDSLLRALRGGDARDDLDAWQGHYLGQRRWLQIALEEMVGTVAAAR